MKRLALLLIGFSFSVLKELPAQTIKTKLVDWTIDSVILMGNDLATMYFSKEFDIINPSAQIRIMLPSGGRGFWTPEAWAYPTLPALTVEILHEPIDPDKIHKATRYEKWKDSLETLKDTVRQLKIKLETVERGLSLLEKNWELPENADALDETLDMWLAYHLIASESLLVRKAYLETVIQKLEEQIKSIETFLDRKQPSIKTRTVLVIKPYSNKAGKYKIVLRVHTRSFSLTPLMNVYVQTKAETDNPDVKVDWIVKVSQNTGIDWKNTTIVYYPEAVEPSSSKIERSPFRYIVTLVKIYRINRSLFGRRKEVLYAPKLGGKGVRSMNDITIKEPVLQEKSIPEISIDESKLLPTIIRIRNATILDGSVRSFNVISKAVENAIIDLYAFSGSELAVYTLSLPIENIRPIIAESVSLFYNGNLMGKRNLTIEETSEKFIKLPIIAHPLIRVKTKQIEIVEKTGLFKRSKAIRFSVSISANVSDSLNLKYATIMRLESKLLNFTITGMEQYKMMQTQKGTDHYIEWEIPVMPSKTINLTYEITFTTKRKYGISISTFSKDAF